MPYICPRCNTYVDVPRHIDPRADQCSCNPYHLLMNINDFMGELGPTPELSLEALQNLCDARERTFMGFMEREHDNGIMFVPFDLRTPKGQDVARLLFWRCLEEYAESISASSREHRLEEVIDAINYALAALVVVPFDMDTLLNYLRQGFDVSHGVRKDSTRERLGTLTYNLAGVTEHFRNRSWMMNAQSTYFEGLHVYKSALIGTLGQLIQAFLDWDEFWRYFMAKDAVLQFRLRSNY